jgi:hypothetical protein
LRWGPLREPGVKFNQFGFTNTQLVLLEEKKIRITDERKSAIPYDQDPQLVWPRNSL